MIRDTLGRTKEWMELAIPEPKEKNIRTQMGVHFEEISEMLSCLGSDDWLTKFLLEGAMKHLKDLADHLKSTDGEIIIKDRVEYLDSLCDQIVTSVGCAHNSKMDIVGAMKEVNRSNFSKFVDGKPVFNENLKIIKGPDYSKPKLDDFA